MTVPFTEVEFFAVFAAYNRSVWPAQIGLFVLGVVLLLAALSDRARYASLRAAGLAALWIWMALVYHWTFFRVINPLAQLFAGLFLLQAILFLGEFVFARENAAPIERTSRVPGVAMVSYALVLYPVVGWLFGLRYPQSPTFGLPCPTIIATFGILALRRNRAPWWLLIVPTIWAVVGTGGALLFGVYQDLGLAAAALSFWAFYRQGHRMPTLRPALVK